MHGPARRRSTGRPDRISVLVTAAIVLLSCSIALAPARADASHPGGVYHKTLLPSRWWLTAADYDYDYYYDYYNDYDYD